MCLRSVDHHDAMAGALTLVGLVGLQAAIGILTLVQQVPIGLALAHQAMAVVLLTIAVLHAGRLAAKQRRVIARRARVRRSPIQLSNSQASPFSLRNPARAQFCFRFCSLKRGSRAP